MHRVAVLQTAFDFSTTFSFGEAVKPHTTNFCILVGFVKVLVSESVADLE
jgi:hypothetical protein